MRKRTRNSRSPIAHQSSLADIKTSKNYVRTAMGELLAGKPVSTASTTAYGCTIKY